MTETTVPAPQKKPFSRTAAGVLLTALLIMILLQGLRTLAVHLLAPRFPNTRFSEQMLNMGAMILLADLLIVAANVFKRSFSLFPDRFSGRYIALTCVTAALYIATPANYTGGFRAVLLLVYGSIVTPGYEELLFRGLIWNECAGVMENEKKVWLYNVLLFTLWQLGYVLPQLLDGNWSAVLLKLAAGLGCGLVLGFVRLKTKNTYACILVHGILNLFMA